MTAPSVGNRDTRTYAGGNVNWFPRFAEQLGDAQRRGRCPCISLTIIGIPVMGLGAGFLGVVLEPMAMASWENLLEMQIRGLYLRSIVHKCWGSEICFIKASG